MPNFQIIVSIDEIKLFPEEATPIYVNEPARLMRSFMIMSTYALNKIFPWKIESIACWECDYLNISVAWRTAINYLIVQFLSIIIVGISVSKLISLFKNENNFLIYIFIYNPLSFYYWIMGLPIFYEIAFTILVFVYFYTYIKEGKGVVWLLVLLILGLFLRETIAILFVMLFFSSLVMRNISFEKITMVVILGAVSLSVFGLFQYVIYINYGINVFYVYFNDFVPATQSGGLFLGWIDHYHNSINKLSVILTYLFILFFFILSTLIIAKSSLSSYFKLLSIFSNIIFLFLFAKSNELILDTFNWQRILMFNISLWIIPFCLTIGNAFLYRSCSTYFYILASVFVAFSWKIYTVLLVEPSDWVRGYICFM
ncbi:hypothetical protein [Desulfonatronum thioautotrophicum]|uniref:hypothetical protein n=1 Tax=Desulfonatronum thioautotrophicum TaxID=617001 RepID=UPI00129474F5|nr:hypothetical protein [Desulfonatronum thioautotrophicum]